MNNLNFNIKDIIETDLVRIWEKHKTESFTQIPPLAVADIPYNSIIFIGINPSLSEIDRNRLLDSNIKIEFYKHGNSLTHKYFKKFIDISIKTNTNWGHFDLLYIRETNQKSIENLITTNEGLDFIYSQLMISKKILNQIIENTNPKIFVVNNTFSRKLLGKEKVNDRNIWMDLHFNWDDEIGTYKYKNIPFFFTSMLTGQRALDIGSYERLVWQINRILK